jgi:hypothetical protein
MRLAVIKLVMSGAAEDAALRSRLFVSVAIARTFGLCCGFGPSDGAVSYRDFSLGWNTRHGGNAGARLTPAQGLILRRIDVLASD